MSILETPLCGLLGVRFPIVQAPMANNAPPALAAAVSEAGALGSIAGATLPPDELRAAIREVREATDRPFAVNLFAPPYLRDGNLEVVLDERPRVVSLTFGVLDPAPLRAAGIVTLGTATRPRRRGRSSRPAWTPSSCKEPKRAAIAGRSWAAFRSCRSRSSSPRLSMPFRCRWSPPAGSWAAPASQSC